MLGDGNHSQVPTEIFTVGHSTHATSHFVNLLTQHKVTAVCDVRSQPYSRSNPHYNRETIAAELKSHGIEYVFLGGELGARSDNPACYVDGKVQFDKLANEPAFQTGLARLRRGVKKYAIALMCAEKDPLTCHRTILVTRRLRDEFAIKHILADGEIETNDAAEARLLKMFNLHRQVDLLRATNECSAIDAAYNLQSEKIAYRR